MMTFAFAFAGCDALTGGLTTAGAGGAAKGKGQTTADAGKVSGVVLGENGLPAPGVRVTAFLTSASPLVGNAGGGLIGNAGSGLIGNAGSGLAGNSGSAYRLGTPFRVQAGSAITDAAGRFTLQPAATGTFNIEAVKSDSSKAWKAEINYKGQNEPLAIGEVRLAPTGHLAGRVTAPDAPTVTDFTGVDVFIPGSSYVAKTDAEGRYTLSNVAEGVFLLYATKTGLGDARAPGVRVESRKTSTAPDLALGVKAPAITRISPDNGGPGQAIAVTGEHFGASTGKSFEVSFNGSAAVDAERSDDRGIRVVVPPGATSGNLLVKVEGILSNPVAFQIIKSLRLLPDGLDLLLGTTATLSVSALDTGDNLVAAPAVDWKLAGQMVGMLGDGAVRNFVALATGDATISVASGTASRSARITAFRIDAVRLTLAAPVIVDGTALTPSALTLYAPPADGTPADSGFPTTAQLVATVEASDSRPRKAVWSSSHPNLVKVADGLIQAERVTQGGTAIVTARSADDASKVATASVTVRVEGSLDLGVQ